MSGSEIRVQRLATEWPVLHLEPEIPPWTSITVDGAVRHPRRFGLDALQALAPVQRAISVHCVWGWSRLGVVWAGVDAGALLALAEPEGGWVTVGSASGVYSACLPLADAAAGLLAWGRDGEPLTAEAGGPLRFVPPASYWAYKGVKWVARLTVVDAFRAGPWEARVADPLGRIPAAGGDGDAREGSGP